MPILDWFNKKEALKTADKTPYKVLVENKELSYGDQTQGNMLIKGDNLEALKSTLKEPNNAQRVIVKTYNYNLKTSEEVSIFDAMSIKGISQDDVKAKIRVQIVNAIKEAKAIEASGYGTYTRNADDSIYDVKNISEFFFREDGTLYIVYAYGNNNYTSELDIIQI